MASPRVYIVNQRINNIVLKKHIPSKCTRYKYKANKRNIIWALPLSNFKNLLLQNCHYCNQKPSMSESYRGKTFYFNGIDRVDSTDGYVNDNCVSCCWLCNRAKGNLTIDKFLDWIGSLKRATGRKFL